MSKNIVTSLMAVICLVNIATALEPPIYIGGGNSTDIVDGDKVWLAGDNFATTPLADWDFGTNFEYMSPDPAPAEVYKDSYHKNNWCDLSEYDEISVPVANGSYLVRLHMFSNDTTHRKMDVVIEGVLILDDYDSQAEAVLLGASTGANAIVIPEVIVEVSDGDGMQIRDSAGDMGGGCSDTWIGAIEIHNAIIKNVGILVGWADHSDVGFDHVQIDRLKGMGYDVTVVQQEDIGSAFTIDDANALDLLIFSESVHSSFADPLIGTTTPMMTQEGHAWDNWFHMGASVAASWQFGTEVEIINDTHPIAVAAGLSVGPMTFYSARTAFVTDVASNLAPGAKLIAQMTPASGSGNYAVAFAIDKGAELANGSPAPNRVVGFVMTGHYQVTAETMTDEAWALYDACLDWLVASPQAPEMVAHWPMDEGEGTLVADVVGGNDGTMVGLDPNVAWIADGALGGAVRFANIDATRIEVPHSDVLDFGDEDFTISMWVRYPTPPVEGDTDRWIIKGTNFSPGSGSRYELFHTAGPEMRWTIDNGPANIKSRIQVPDANFISEEWVHVVAVRDSVNDLLALYADGVLQGTATENSGDISSGEVMWIGESTDEQNTPMSGDIDDVRIFDSALTEDQIASIY